MQETATSHSAPTSSSPPGGEALGWLVRTYVLHICLIAAVQIAGMLKRDPRALLGSLAANLVAVQGHAILECSVLKQVTLQRFGDLIEQRSARSQDRGVGVEQ